MEQKENEGAVRGGQAQFAQEADVQDESHKGGREGGRMVQQRTSEVGGAQQAPGSQL